MKRSPIVWCVTGGRKFADWPYVERSLEALARERGLPGVLVHGDAPGADQLGKRWGKARGVIVVDEPAQWTRFGRAAGGYRNGDMLDIYQPDVVIAFPGDVGTRNMITQTLQAKHRVELLIALSDGTFLPITYRDDVIDLLPQTTSAR